MRVLVVEDYAPLRVSVAKALREEGHSVDEAEEGEVAWSILKRTQYDVVVLDIMLPGLSGLEILTRLRRAGNGCQVLLLTAKDTVEDRIQGLDGGADDYLVKPFAIGELLARVRALLRREYVKKETLIDLGHVQVNTVNHEVHVEGELVVLTAKEYALLEYLAMRQGEIVTRTSIWEHIYDEHSEATSNVVDVYVGYLRKKLERPGRPKLLRTKRGEGYMLIVEVQ